ncbi:hypothetical protein BH20GEM2_BH20GEM2_14210 [soil metagenome]
MNTLLQDLRFARRTLRRAPLFTAAAVAALALGSGLAFPLLALVDTGLARGFDPFGVAGAEPLLEAVPVALPEHPLSAARWTDEVQTIARVQAEGLDTLLWILGAAALLVVGIVCSSVLILLLSRATARRREMTLRGVFGAGRCRMARQLMTEGALLGALGGGAGLLLGLVGLGILHASWPEGMERWLGFAVGWRAFALALGVPLLVTLLFGLAPALAAWRRDLHGALTTGGRATADAREGGQRNVLIVLAVAVSVMLLTCSGLLLRGFHSLQGDGGTGIDSQSTLTLQLDLTQPRYATDAERAAFYQTTLARIAALPGVVDTSVASRGAWMGLGNADRVRAVCPECVRGSMILPVTQGIVRHHVVSPGFFAAHGVPLVRGREFAPTDAAETPSVAVIDESFAYRLFPNGEPLGKQIQVGGRQGEWYTVVGIVRGIRARGIGMGSEPVPSLYLSALQHPPRSVGLAVRTTTDSMTLAPAVEAAIHAIDPAQNVYAAMTMEAQLARFLAPLRWFSLVFGALALLAVLLCAHGLYGVISYNVARRTREIGIRMALGAQLRQVMEMVVRQSLRLTALGTFFGVIGALSVARLMQLLLLGVRPLDPVIYGGVALLLGVVALLASYLPARRAARVNPTVALQAE